jgi:hypothetical protein
MAKTICLTSLSLVVLLAGSPLLYCLLAVVQGNGKMWALDTRQLNSRPTWELTSFELDECRS